jgi:hypothetical protein
VTRLRCVVKARPSSVELSSPPATVPTVPSAATAGHLRAAIPGTTATSICQLKPTGRNIGSVTCPMPGGAAGYLSASLRQILAAADHPQVSPWLS